MCVQWPAKTPTGRKCSRTSTFHCTNPKPNNIIHEPVKLIRGLNLGSEDLLYPLNAQTTSHSIKTSTTGGSRPHQEQIHDMCKKSAECVRLVCLSIQPCNRCTMLLLKTDVKCVRLVCLSIQPTMRLQSRQKKVRQRAVEERAARDRDQKFRLQWLTRTCLASKPTNTPTGPHKEKW